jgi:hypothetical protein
MAKRVALVVALAVTVVVGFALLAIGGGAFQSNHADTSGAETTPVTGEVVTADQAAESNGSADATPAPRESDEPYSRESHEDEEDDEHEEREGHEADRH